MTRRARIVLSAVVAFVVTTAAVLAQELASSFDALAARVNVGQPVWVTGADGREIHGRLERLSTDGLVLRRNGLQTFAASDVRRLRARARDSLKNGTLIGAGIGAGMGTAWCLGAIADDSGDVDARVECAEGFIVFPALGALIGLAVDAIIPGKLRVLYQASAPQGAPGASMVVRPCVSSRVNALTVSFTF
jgi:hypothetical protein